MKGLQVWSLLRELRSHMPQGQKTKTQNIKHCNKFNKDFKKKKISFKLEWDHPTPPWGPWTESYGPTDVWNPSVETIHLHSNLPKFKINLIIPFSLLYLMIQNFCWSRLLHSMPPNCSLSSQALYRHHGLSIQDLHQHRLNWHEQIINKSKSFKISIITIVNNQRAFRGPITY